MELSKAQIGADWLVKIAKEAKPPHVKNKQKVNVSLLALVMQRLVDDIVLEQEGITLIFKNSRFTIRSGQGYKPGTYRAKEQRVTIHYHSGMDWGYCHMVRFSKKGPHWEENTCNHICWGSFERPGTLIKEGRLIDLILSLHSYINSINVKDLMFYKHDWGYKLYGKRKRSVAQSRSGKEARSVH